MCYNGSNLNKGCDVMNMNMKEEVAMLLNEKRYAKLVGQALRNPGLLRYLYRLFYHPYGLARWRAIEGLGHISAAMAKENPEGVREILRRLLWAMNDESGTASWSSPEAIGEIIYHNPEKFQEYISIVVYASEEEIFHRGIAWALGRIAQRRSDLLEEYIPLLRDFLSHPKPDVRGHAAWSLGQMGAAARVALPELRALQQETTMIEMYHLQEITLKAVGEIASEAIKRLEG